VLKGNSTLEENPMLCVRECGIPFAVNFLQLWAFVWRWDQSMLASTFLLDLGKAWYPATLI